MAARIVVYEDFGWQRMLPLVYIRAVFQLICGMDDLLGKVRRLCDGRYQENNGKPAPLELWCRPGIADVVQQSTSLAVNRDAGGSTLLLNGRGLWSRLPQVDGNEPSWVGTVGSQQQVACIFADADLAQRLSPTILLDQARTRAALAGIARRDVSPLVELFDWPWQLIHANPRSLVGDWRQRTTDGDQIWDLEWNACERAWTDWKGEVSDGDRILGSVAEGSYLLAREAIHVGRNSRIKPCVVIDAEDGPVWIGNDVTILPHSYVQGPAYIGDGCLLQPGAVVHEGTTIGPRCKIGGEIEASIIQGYSNKQHDGFLGHSYLASWVNIAADCINSDLKNTYGTVRVPINGRSVETEEMFMGMIVGDYSKAGINVSFPTGAVLGFCSSVFASRSPKFVPSFAWVDGESIEAYDPQRGVSLARKVMRRRDRIMTPAEEAAFLAVPQQALAIEYAPHRYQDTTAAVGSQFAYRSETWRHKARKPRNGMPAQ